MPRSREASIRWRVSKFGAQQLAPARALIGSNYEQQKQALQRLLAMYFESDCDRKAMNISPIAGAPSGGKALKVRWAYPGCGKRGGLRLLVVANCDTRTAAVTGCWLRKEDPTDAEILAALNSL
ncbi:hypothetical protein [Haliangium sp. UPWRP_2]|uniref:hypothetical protein n=1 Tax=Haliangium sp. UPWRP_2 TaxID=1931276 RepID=UPI000B542023|nr:hypothetical protein [Haliangium sp. UPWRP_2]PSM32366.1 hypothetical protein BVG81_000590 [Haliangium sp. UPWRP_2]HNN97715.1 hypothetical protein [Pseudomonadota bacterium]